VLLSNFVTMRLLGCSSRPYRSMARGSHGRTAIPDPTCWWARNLRGREVQSLLAERQAAGHPTTASGPTVSGPTGMSRAGLGGVLPRDPSVRSRLLAFPFRAHPVVLRVALFAFFPLVHPVGLRHAGAT